jgi:hypothetical protein
LSSSSGFNTIRAGSFSAEKIARHILIFNQMYQILHYRIDNPTSRGTLVRRADTSTGSVKGEIMTDRVPLVLPWSVYPDFRAQRKNAMPAPKMVLFFHP